MTNPSDDRVRSQVRDQYRKVARGTEPGCSPGCCRPGPSARRSACSGLAAASVETLTALLHVAGFTQIRVRSGASVRVEPGVSVSVSRLESS